MRNKNPLFARLTGPREALFSGVLYVSALGIVALLGAIFCTLLRGAMPSIRASGFGFVWGTTWDPVFGTFGIAPFLVGTLLTSFLALILSLPFSLAVSLCLGEYMREGAFSTFLRTMTELLAGIPSVIYGLWGLFFLAPLMRSLEMFMGIPPYGVGIATASVILAVMIIPYSASIGRDVIGMVPHDLKEAAYSLGGTRYEVIRRIVLPTARSGIIAGFILALGRALGETMAVTMVIGNTNFLPRSIFSTGNTMASVIANEFAEATGRVYLSALIEIGLVLFVLTLVINMAGRAIIKRISI